MWRSLARVRSDWNRHAETDPLWAIYTDPHKKNGRWEPGPFFETGRQEIEELMSYVGSLNVALGRGRALDFGCGVGRLTRALASHFEEVCGVDISPKMIELAREYNTHLPNCHFKQNIKPDFDALVINDFDLIYSSVTLQHVPPRHAMRYLRGLIGLLRPGGLLVFQLPSEKRAKLADRVRSVLYEEIYKRYILREPPSMDMYGVRKHQVIDFMERNGCRIVGVEPNYMAGPEWSSYRYAVVRQTEAPAR